MNILDHLAIGDKRATGYADKAAVMMLADNRLIAEVFSGLYAQSPGLRMRCADALAKVAAKKPALLWPHKKALIQNVARSEQQEVQWHVAEILGYINLTPVEAKIAGRILERYFDSSSSRILRVNALQALVTLSHTHAILKKPARRCLSAASASGIPSLAARARKLYKPRQRRRNNPATKRDPNRKAPPPK